jgi:hypothetical protein
MHKLLYIAETDGEGHIACVWLHRPAARSIRVFDPSRHRFDPNVPAEFSGAHPMAIMSWLAAAQFVPGGPKAASDRCAALTASGL